MKLHFIVLLLAITKIAVSAQLPVGSELFENSAIAFEEANKDFKINYRKIIVSIVGDDKKMIKLKEKVRKIQDKPHQERSENEKEIIKKYTRYLRNGNKELQKQSKNLRTIISVMLKNMNNIAGMSTVASKQCSLVFPTNIQPTSFNNYEAVGGKVVGDISSSFFVGVAFMEKNITPDFDCEAQINRNIVLKNYYSEMEALKTRTNMLFQSLGL